MKDIQRHIHFTLIRQLAALDSPGRRTGRVPVAEAVKVAEAMEQAAVDHDRELAFLMKERDKHKRREIEDAIRRIERGTYGICTVCGEDIGLRRLMANPATRLCYHCQDAGEKKGKPGPPWTKNEAAIPEPVS
ncbi:MAG: TraR/DksA family transcriptional regulator [Syntrophales bacterium]|nr:TraR/DksA family transcriptional regulator [Syntrophales bacterium]